MACQSCAERRAAMKVWLGKQAENARKWAAVRAGNAEEPASDTRAEHEQQGVEATEAASPDERRVSVPRVRKARSR